MEQSLFFTRKIADGLIVKYFPTLRGATVSIYVNALIRELNHGEANLGLYARCVYM